MRVKFGKGEQREFLQKVLIAVGAPSLKELSWRVGVNYSSLKNYFIEERTLSKELFGNLCLIAHLNEKRGFIEENWGQVKGGKKSRRESKI